jgi:putative ATP-binding cassette transporter
MSSIARVVTFLFKFSRQLPLSRLLFVTVIGLGMVGGLANTALIAVINSRLHGDAGRLLPWTFIGLCVCMPLCRLASNVMLLRLAQKAVLAVRLQLSRRILQAPFVDLERIGAARLLAVLTEDVGAITTALIDIPLLTMQLTIVLGCLVYLAWLSWPGFFIVLGFMAVGVVTYQLPMRLADVHFRRARQLGDALFANLRALTEGIKELKLHARRREDFVNAGLDRASVALQRETFQGNAVATAAASWGQILSFVLVGVIVFLMPRMQAVDSRTLTGFALTILYMITPLEAVLNIVPQFSRAGVSVAQVEKLGLSLSESAVREPDAAVEPAAAWHRLELAGVTHSYQRENQEDSFQLGPIDLSLAPGELVLITGGNGSGKTTLAKLLIGLYAPEAGEIRLDGEPITAATRDRYRQLFAVVFTDFFLFETLFGLQAPALDDQARRYLQALHLDSKVTVKDGVLSTIKLSQGQRKRLALLTAYLEDRPIYLFDEWAADQDPYFKQIFYHQLLPELRARGKTVLVISHDDHYYHVADRMIKLDFGRIEMDRVRERGGVAAAAAKELEHAAASQS